MNVGFYGHVHQYHNIQSEIDENIRTVLESGQYVMGPVLQRFEKELAGYHGMKFAIGVANGTDALWLSFLALGIGPGDECITTTNTFFATAEAIWIAGATAVFVDSDPRTNCLDPSRVEADDRRIHPCNFESAYKAFEITMAFCRSVAERGQIKLPLASSADELEMLRLSLPPRDVLLSMAANAREYQS